MKKKRREFYIPKKEKRSKYARRVTIHSIAVKNIKSLELGFFKFLFVNLKIRI